MQKNEVLSLEKHTSLPASTFENKYLKNKDPVIITNALNWDALKKWSPDFLKATYVDKDISLTVMAPEINMPGNELKLKFTQAVDLICNNSDEGKKYYMMQRSIYDEFPELVKDIEIPIYADKSKEHVINFWFGEKGINTKPHYDYSNNFLVQVVGKKRVRLFSPKNTPHMYPYSMYDCVTMDGVSHPAVQASQIADIDKIDHNKFSDFKLSKCFEAILEPGDLLFIPAGWWHEVKSLDVSMSVNFWWKIKIEHFPARQLTNVVCSYFHWYEDLFHEKIRLAFDLTDFKNDLQVAEFCLDKDLKCVSALFTLSYINNKVKNNPQFANKLAQWKGYLESAKNSDEQLLETDKIKDIIDEVNMSVIFE